MNVIVVMLDSLRKDHLGCYGNERIHTPNLDEFAKESVTFTRAFPEALPTIPVRKAMHTGMRAFPNRGYVPRKGDTVKIAGWEPMPENQITMSEVFKHEKYLTALFCSTYHMFKPSMNFHRGFTEWEWIRGQEHDPYRTPLKGDVEDLKNLPCELAYGCVGHGLASCLANIQGWKTKDDWFPAKTFGAAIQWLERNRDADRFFLVVDEFDPHEPWCAPKPMLDLYFDTASYKGRRIINTRSGPYRFREGELEYTRAQYAAEVTLVDKYVGRLLDKVKELGFWENTVVMVLSDHGHPIMEHGILHKVAPLCLYPELTDLVYMIYHPAKQYAGTRCDAYVSTHDVTPTLLALAGIALPVEMEGRDVWEWVTEETNDRREYMTLIYGGYVWCQDEEYAYIANLDGGDVRLYDLREDPEQRRNIADQKPDVCGKMYKRVLTDAGGSLPHHQIRRPGLPWYDSAWI
ncbi:MAG: sulfatase [Candidatus Bathyarchaeota archaeon]|nr:sulfatase [Candidatus Bathyarchaeota archaeon]